MRARFVLILSLCVLLFCLLQTTLIPLEVKAPSVFHVHNLNTGLNYATIQEAIDDPLTLNGHTISIEEGTYYENVIVNKSVSIAAENRTNTIIDGNETGTTLRIVQDATNIEGFLMRNSGCWPDACIRLENVSDCSVSANLFENNNKTGLTFVGIFLYSSQRNNIAGNDIRNNNIGIDLLLSSNNTITENHIANAHLGIQTGNSSNCNVIFENNLTNCEYGVALNHEAQYNTISQNHIEYSSEVGVAIETASGNNSVFTNIITNNFRGIRVLWSSDNRLYHNRITDNNMQAYVSEGYTNQWDDGYPSGGNYWSDYNGTDANHDGIGDTPYIIDANNTDNYPLMVPYVIPEFPSLLILPLFMMATLLAVIAYKRKH